MIHETLRTMTVRALIGGAVLLTAASPLWAAGHSAGVSDKAAARARTLRKDVPSLPFLVRTTPNIYLVRIETVDTPDSAGGADHGVPPQSTVTASVLKTVKGTSRAKLTLTVRLRRPGAAMAGLFGGDVSADPSKFQNSPAFFSPKRFLSPRNPMFGGPSFKTGRIYLLFTGMDGKTLRGGPYGYQQVNSVDSFWVQTVRHLVAKPGSKHAVKMSFPDFVKRHRSAFLMMVGDCLGTEVVISKPLWGDPVSRKEIDPGQILPESADECAGVMDKKRGYLGFIERRPYLYQLRDGYPNQTYVEISDGKVDFSELHLDIGFPGGGKISVEDLAAQLSGGQAR